MKKNSPRKILPTRFDGYYVSDDGRIFTDHPRHWRWPRVKGQLREMTQNPRGGTDPNDRYLSINISIRDENGKYLRQMKYYSHRLIAEVFVDNPNNYEEIDHIDMNKKNNHISNLRWVDRKENMAFARKK